MKIEINIKADTTTKNRKFYPKKTLEESFDKYIKEKEGLIYLDSDSASKGDLLKVVGKVDKYSIDGKDISLEGKILDTPVSKIMEESFGDKLVISPIGYGKLNDDNVIEDYQLVGFSVSLEN